jgi:CHAT domain-containing protein
LEKVLSTKSQLFASQHDKAKKSWIDVRNTLGDKEAAIEIIRIQKKFRSDSVIYVALIVTNEMTDTPDFVVLGEGNKMESRWFNFYRNSIKFSIGNNISYDGYWLAISQKLDGIDRVYFSADGIYNKININTLWDPVKELSVIEDLELRIVSNTRELTEVHQVNEDRPNTAEIYGFPDFNLGAEFDDMGAVAVNRTSEYGFSKGIASLPGTKVEVEEIAKMLTENNWVGNIRTSAEATEDKFKNIDSPRLLHIATHGFFMNDIEYSDRDQSSSSHNDLNANPLLRSGVLLTGSAKAMILDQKSDGEDGIVTAYEAMNLNLDNTEIVVLSACETGLGEVRNGEGVYGLQRAFIVAGAQNVIMSLWKVNDLTTQELMAGFYQRWLGGMDKFQAFKETQLALKNKYNDPYHWGSFVLLGK